MKCPKCGYTSFAYLESCRKCGREYAETRAPFGVYARRPTAPDLMANLSDEMDAADASLSSAIDLSQLDHLDLALANDAEDAAGSLMLDEPHTPEAPMSTPSVPAIEPISPAIPTIDLAQLGEIEFELPDDAEESGPTPLETPQPSTAPFDLSSTLGLESEEDNMLLGIEADAEPPEPTALGMPSPLIDLSQLDGIDFEAEDPSAQTDATRQETRDSREVPLDIEPNIEEIELEDTSQSLTLVPAPGSSDVEDTDAVEYVLEVEDVLEFEVDELMLDDEEDDSDR